jgi:hypothetical protein
MTELEIEIPTPTNISSVAFVRRVYRAIEAKNRELLEKYRRELAKLITDFRLKLEEKLGLNKSVIGTIVLVIDEEGKPTKLYTKDVKIIEQRIEPLVEKIEVSL